MGDATWEDLLEEVEVVRRDVAQFVNSPPEEIAFVGSTSHAMNYFAMAIKKKCEEKGEPLPRVLTMEDEFPSTTIAWLKHGFSLDFVQSQNGMYPIEDIEKNIGSETKVLLTSYVQYCTGFKQSLKDLAELKKKHNLIVVLNATQALGAEPTDFSQFDFACASVHKWLMSGLGLAVAKYSKEFLPYMPVAGWISQKKFMDMRNNVLDEIQEAKALEVGCAPYLQIVSLGAYIKWLSENGGIKEISERIRDLVKTAKEKLKAGGISLIYDFPEKFQSGIIMVHSKNAEHTTEQLMKKGVYVTPRGKGLRLSIHYFNNESDIDRFIEAYREVEASTPCN